MQKRLAHNVLAAALAAGMASASLAQDTSASLFMAITQSNAAIQAEILKSAIANKTVQEGIAAYRWNEYLRAQAAELQRDMQQSAQVCQDMGSQDVLAQGAQRARANSFAAQRRILARAAGNTNSLNQIELAHKASNDKFCSQTEAASGVCKGSTDPSYVNLAGADQNAMFLFQSRTGGETYEGASNGAQAQAANAYIARVVNGPAPPEELPAKGRAAYQSNPQSRAYMESMRRYNAFLSMASYSLNRLKESHIAAPK